MPDVCSGQSCDMVVMNSVIVQRCFCSVLGLERLVEPKNMLVLVVCLCLDSSRARGLVNQSTASGLEAGFVDYFDGQCFVHKT